MGLAQCAKVINAKEMKTEVFLSVLFLLEKSDFHIGLYLKCVLIGNPSQKHLLCCLALAFKHL